MYNNVTGNLLQSKTILQMQVIGVRMKGQFISNFTDEFHQIIWNAVKSLEVMLSVEQAWQMELAPIFQYKPCAANYLLVNMDAFGLQWVKTSIGTQTRGGSTMINTTWHAKIDAQQTFYFVILSVEGALIDIAVSMKAMLELFTDAHGT